MSASCTSRLGRLGVACGVVVAGMAVGLVWGPLGAPRHVQAQDRSPRGLVQHSPGQVSIVANAILYDVVTYVVDLPIIMNNAR